MSVETGLSPYDATLTLKAQSERQLLTLTLALEQYRYNTFDIHTFVLFLLYYLHEVNMCLCEAFYFVQSSIYNTSRNLLE